MKQFKVVLILVLIIFSFNAFAENLENIPRMSEIEGKQRDEAKWRAYFTPNREHSFDVNYYDLYLEIDPSTHFIDGTNHITMTSMESGLSEIELDLVDLTVDDVKMNGASVGYTHENGVITVSLDGTYNIGEQFTVIVEYNGHPTTGIYFFDGFPEISTHNEPSDARFWFPCWDHPSDKADSVSTHITLPVGWLVVSNGVETGVIDNGNGTMTSHWHSQYPITSYLVAFAASPNYEIYPLEYVYNSGADTMPMPHYIHSQDIGSSFDNMPAMMASEAGMFGEYPFIEEKYSQASFHIFTGGMENQTCTFIHSLFIDGTHNADVWLFSHELAHQWWGDAVTCGSWADMWLNEGFASFTEALYYEDLGGDIRDWLLQVMLASYLNINYEHPIYNPPPGYLFSTIVYEKAGLVLRMIQGIAGEDGFYDILDYYYAQNAYDVAYTAEFQEACETIVPDYDWDTFFQQWIYDEGRPIFEVKWDYWETLTGDYQVEACLKQVQGDDWGVFVMPSEVGIYYGSDEEEYELADIQIDDWETYVSMTVQNEPVEFVFDPWEWFVVKEKEINRANKFSVQGITLDDADGDEILEPGESVNLILNLKNNLAAANEVTGTISTSDPNIQIDTETSGFGSIGAGATGNNSTSPFVLTIIGDPEPHDAIISIDLITSTGYAGTVEFEIFVGKGDVLLVDDDGEADYESYYIESLEELNLIPQVKSVALSGNPVLEMLSEYSTVIWFTGDEGENTLTENDRNNLATFLDNGGSLFLSGQNIGDEIGETSFFADYLHADHTMNAWTTSTLLKGADGDPIGDGAMLMITGDNCANNQDSPSVVTPLDEAENVFGYMPLYDQNVGGIRYEGDYKLVYFCFGFEGVNNSDGGSLLNRTDLMSRVLDYLGVDVGIKDLGQIQVPTKYRLNQNYPNPFNPTTTISFDLPKEGKVNLGIYDMSGKLVKNLVDDEMDAGCHSFIWDGSDQRGEDLESGVYIYKIKTDNFVETKQCILIK